MGNMILAKDELTWLDRELFFAKSDEPKAISDEWRERFQKIVEGLLKSESVEEELRSEKSEIEEEMKTTQDDLDKEQKKNEEWVSFFEDVCSKLELNQDFAEINDDKRIKGLKKKVLELIDGLKRRGRRSNGSKSTRSSGHERG